MSNAETDLHPFVTKFAAAWRGPTSAAQLGALLHDDVLLLQPLSPPLRGIDAARREFERIFALLPDLQAEVDGALAHGDTLHITFRLMGHLGRRWLEWRAVDVFTLRDGKAVQRVSYFDALPLVLAVLVTPASWWRWWRSGLARPSLLWALRPMKARPGLPASPQ